MTTEDTTDSNPTFSIDYIQEESTWQILYWDTVHKKMTVYGVSSLSDSSWSCMLKKYNSDIGTFSNLEFIWKRLESWCKEPPRIRMIVVSKNRWLKNQLVGLFTILNKNDYGCENKIWYWRVLLKRIYLT